MHVCVCIYIYKTVFLPCTCVQVVHAEDTVNNDRIALVQYMCDCVIEHAIHQISIYMYIQIDEYKFIFDMIYVYIYIYIHTHMLRTVNLANPGPSSSSFMGRIRMATWMFSADMLVTTAAAATRIHAQKLSVLRTAKGRFEAPQNPQP